MCRNTAESRKLFYSGCILNIRNGQKREKPVAGVFKIKAARYPFCSGTGQPVWWFGRKKIKSFGKNLKLRAIPHNSKCRYGERGAADAKPKAQIILDAAKVSAASGGYSEPKQGQRSQSARGFCPPKHDAGTATRHYRAFWQRRCRAAAAGAVLKPQGGNCAVLP